MTGQSSDDFARLHVPDPDGGVIRTGSYELSIGAEGDTGDTVGRPGETADDPGCGDIPQNDRMIVRTGERRLAIRSMSAFSVKSMAPFGGR